MNQINCPLCNCPIAVKPAQGRKSKKPFLMLVCAVDGRHFRGFISDQDYVRKIVEESGVIPREAKA